MQKRWYCRQGSHSNYWPFSGTEESTHYRCGIFGFVSTRIWWIRKNNGLHQSRYIFFQGSLPLIFLIFHRTMKICESWKWLKKSDLWNLLIKASPFHLTSFLLDQLWSCTSTIHAILSPDTRYTGYSRCIFIWIQTFFDFSDLLCAWPRWKSYRRMDSNPMLVNE